MQLNSTYLPRSSKCSNTILNNLVMQRGKKLPQNSWRKKAFYAYTTRIWLLIKNYRKYHNDWTHVPASQEFPLTETVGGTVNEVWLSTAILAPIYCWFCTNCLSNEVCVSNCFCFLIFKLKIAHPEYVCR